MKNELAKQRFAALIAGFLLLVGTATLERTPSAASLIPGVGAGSARGANGSALERGVIAALAAKAPRLDPVLSGRIAASIARCGREQALAPDLVLAVLMQESSGRPGAHSPKGAIGLMQVMPHMYEVLALPGSAAHVEANIEAGCRLLADNIARLGEERVQSLRLSQRARESIQQPAGERRVSLHRQDRVAHQRQHDVVRHQLSRREHAFHFLAELALGGDGFAQQVSGRNVPELQLIPQPFGLRALPGSRGTEQHQVHLASATL